jgi:predicted RNase H-like nuclease (RuvC/YqgF family)
MDGQDKKFNSRIILTALVAVMIGILIAFYYSYAQSRSEIVFLEQEKELLVKDLTMMKADVDRLSALNEVYEIELESSKYRIQELLDSVGRLNFTVEKLRELKTELRRLEAKNDSLKLKNNFLRYNNMLLSDKNQKVEKEIEELRRKNSALAEAEARQRQQREELNQQLKIKNYLKLRNAEGSGFRLRSGRPIQTNKASIIEKLRGCVTVAADAATASIQKVIYFQFLNPDMLVIEDNANTILVNGNVYSKRVELRFTGEDTNVCDFITIPQGSLDQGNYRLNIFEDEKLLSTTEFELK